tara:strand:+ start:728 stop:2353 length:1626 start_codon:yes stop_codon:yes gene_type:complete
MKVIMEGWRRYCDDVLASIPAATPEALQENKIHLFESDSLVPSGEVDLATLLEQYDQDVITTDELIETFQRSSEYEYQGLIDEGLLDTLRAGAEAFKGKSEEAIAKIKAKARAGIATAVVKGLWVPASSVIRAVYFKIKKISDALLSMLKESKIAQSKIGKLVGKLVGLMSKAIGAVLKAVKWAVGKFASFMSHPIVKWVVIVLCVLILVVAAFNTVVFTGALAFAPGFAVRKLGFQAGVPILKAGVKAAFYESLDPHLHEGQQLLLEFTDFDVLMNAVGEILEMLPEESILTSDMSSTFFSGTTEAGAEYAVDIDVIRQNDAALAEAKMAIEELQIAAAKGESVQDVLDGPWATASPILTKAIAGAQAFCEADEAMCVATTALVEDFKLWNTAHIKSEIAQGMREWSEVIDGVADGGHSAVWNMDSANSVETIIQNPLADPEAAAATGRAVASAAEDITGKGGKAYRHAVAFFRNAAGKTIEGSTSQVLAIADKATGMIDAAVEHSDMEELLPYKKALQKAIAAKDAPEIQSLMKTLSEI